MYVRRGKHGDNRERGRTVIGKGFEARRLFLTLLAFAALALVVTACGATSDSSSSSSNSESSGGEAGGEEVVKGTTTAGAGKKLTPGADERGKGEKNENKKENPRTNGDAAPPPSKP